MVGRKEKYTNIPQEEINEPTVESEESLSQNEEEKLPMGDVNHTTNQPIDKLQDTTSYPIDKRQAGCGEVDVDSPEIKELFKKFMYGEEYEYGFTRPVGEIRSSGTYKTNRTQELRSKCIRKTMEDKEKEKIRTIKVRRKKIIKIRKNIKPAEEEVKLLKKEEGPVKREVTPNLRSLAEEARPVKGKICKPLKGTSTTEKILKETVATTTANTAEVEGLGIDSEIENEIEDNVNKNEEKKGGSKDFNGRPSKNSNISSEKIKDTTKSDEVKLTSEEESLVVLVQEQSGDQTTAQVDTEIAESGVETTVAFVTEVPTGILKEDDNSLPTENESALTETDHEELNETIPASEDPKKRQPIIVNTTEAMLITTMKPTKLAVEEPVEEYEYEEITVVEEVPLKDDELAPVRPVPNFKKLDLKPKPTLASRFRYAYNRRPRSSRIYFKRKDDKGRPPFSGVTHLQDSCFSNRTV